MQTYHDLHITFCGGCYLNTYVIPTDNIVNSNWDMSLNEFLTHFESIEANVSRDNIFCYASCQKCRRQNTSLLLHVFCFSFCQNHYLKPVDIESNAISSGDQAFTCDTVLNTCEYILLQITMSKISTFSAWKSPSPSLEVWWSDGLKSEISQTSLFPISHPHVNHPPTEQ